MGYLEQAHEALESGKTKIITSDIYKFEKAGDEIAGIILDVSEFADSVFETTCKKYIIETDEGKKSFVLGACADKRLEGVDLINKLIYIKFNGKIELANQKHINDFDIREF